MSGTCAITLIVIASGVLAGARNIFLEINEGKAFSATMGAQLLLEALLSAATVPLFLSIIGNTIVSAMLDTSTIGSADWWYATLKFAGFCLIAALYSRTFLESLSSKVLQLEKDVKSAKAVAEKVQNTTEKLQETVDVVIEDDDAQSQLMGAVQRADDPTLTVDEIAVLKAFLTENYAIRTAKGVSLSSKLSMQIVENILAALERRALVRSVETRHGKRWAATSAGRQRPEVR